MAPQDLLSNAVGVLNAFIQDIAAVGVEHTGEVWPDLVPTYRDAVIVFNRIVKEVPLCRCANCNTFWSQDVVTPLGCVVDLNQRLDPGGEVPCGECPRFKCRALVYLVKPIEVEEP